MNFGWSILDSYFSHPLFLVNDSLSNTCFQKVVCERVVCERVVCDRAVCQRVVSERIVCDKEVYAKVVSDKVVYDKVVYDKEFASIPFGAIAFLPHGSQGQFAEDLQTLCQHLGKLLTLKASQFESWAGRSAMTGGKCFHVRPVRRISASPLLSYLVYEPSVGPKRISRPTGDRRQNATLLGTGAGSKT